MRNIIKLAVVSSLVTFGAFQTHAARTNEVHGLVINLTALTQGSSTTNGSVVVTTVDKTKLMNKDLIGLLAGLTVSYTDPSNNVVVVSNVTFTTKAALVIKAPASSGPTFFVRDFIGTNKVDYAVSNYMSVQPSDTTAKAAHVNTSSGSQTSTESEILTLNFNNGTGTSFSISGLTTIAKSTINDHVVGIILVAKAVSGNLAGTGTVDNNGAVISGTIGVGTAKIEVN